MSPTSRDTVLFWCQVGLYVTAMVTLLGILATFWFVLTSTMRTMEENRLRDRAMLQQHYTELQQHQDMLIEHRRAREEHARAFDAMLQRHRTSPSE